MVAEARVVALVGAWGCPSEMTETITTDDGVALDTMMLLDIMLLEIMAVVTVETTGTVVVIVVDAIGVVVITGVLDAAAAVVGPCADGVGMTRVTPALRQRVWAN